MTMRYCERCSSEVEDVGGFCLLGHRLALDSLAAPLKDLRAEVDQAFVEAQLEVSEALAVVGARLEAAPPPPPPPPPPATVAPSAPAPPAPPADAGASTPAGAGPWHSLQDEEPLNGDPIAAFAPAPRMDWGPERASRLRRRDSRRNAPGDA